MLRITDGTEARLNEETFFPLTRPTRTRLRASDGASLSPELKRLVADRTK